MKNNYPIKYAVIPMREQIGWIHGLNQLEREYGTVCYIISKCYLVGENTNYYKDGTSEKKYQIVCPFECGEFDIWHKNEPQFYLNKDCYNSMETKAVFDNYEDAKSYKDKKNRVLLNKELLHIEPKDFKIESKKVTEDFNQKLEFYNQLESEIENKTKYLNVQSNPKEQRVIRLKGKEYHKTNSSLYDIINAFDTSNYIIYSVTPKEFMEMQELSDTNQSIERYKHTPLLINNGEQKISKVLSPNNEELYIVKNELLKNVVSPFNKPSTIEEFFYTIEDYQDILLSYSKKYEKGNEIKLVRK